MAKKTAATVKVADLPAVTAAVAEAVAAERNRLLILIRATCACQSCKDGVALILTDESGG